MLSGEIKAELGKCLNDILSKIQEKRACLTDEEVQKFFSRDKRLFMGKYLQDEMGIKNQSDVKGNKETKKKK